MYFPPRPPSPRPGFIRPPGCACTIHSCIIPHPCLKFPVFPPLVPRPICSSASPLSVPVYTTVFCSCLPLRRRYTTRRTPEVGLGPPNAPLLPTGAWCTWPSTTPPPPVVLPPPSVSPMPHLTYTSPASPWSDRGNPHGWPLPPSLPCLISPMNLNQTEGSPVSPPYRTRMIPGCPPPTVAAALPTFIIPPVPCQCSGASLSSNCLHYEVSFQGVGTFSPLPLGGHTSFHTELN